MPWSPLPLLQELDDLKKMFGHLMFRVPKPTLTPRVAMTLIQSIHLAKRRPCRIAAPTILSRTSHGETTRRAGTIGLALGESGSKGCGPFHSIGKLGFPCPFRQALTSLGLIRTILACKTMA